MKRALVIAGVTLHESIRSRLTPLLALLVLLAAPVLAWWFGDDAPTREWLSRMLPVEGLRVLLPLAAITGGAFLLRPALKRGYALLPARRAEWFAGTVLAGAALVLATAGLFAAGAWISNALYGGELAQTQGPTSLHIARGQGNTLELLEVAPGQSMAANPGRGEWFRAGVPHAAELAGEIEFVPIWTQELSPRQGSPVAVWAEGPAGRTPVELSVESRRRVSFRAAANGATHIVIQPIDPALLIGTSSRMIRFNTGQVGAAPSLFAMLALSAGATLLCLCVVLAVRALATAPTAALAGMLLLAALTLLPSAAGAPGMARARRADLEGAARQRSLVERAEQELSQLPQLFPDRHFDEYLAGRAVPGSAWGDGLLRLGAGLLILLPGAWLFTRRQVAK